MIGPPRRITRSGVLALTLHNLETRCNLCATVVSAVRNRCNLGHNRPGFSLALTIHNTLYPHYTRLMAPLLIFSSNGGKRVVFSRAASPLSDGGASVRSRPQGAVQVYGLGSPHLRIETKGGRGLGGRDRTDGTHRLGDHRLPEGVCFNSMDEGWTNTAPRVP